MNWQKILNKEQPIYLKILTLTEDNFAEVFDEANKQLDEFLNTLEI